MANILFYAILFFSSARDRLLKGDMSLGYIARSEVRVVTFDLDNTLWNTTETIAAANNALAEFLDSNNITQPRRVEQIMGELFKADRSRYCPMDENATAPVLLTKLRLDAIRRVLEEHNGYTPDDASAYASKAFDIWTKARHDAIPRNFAPAAISCLEKIASIRTSSGHPVLIGAITDGNSDPRNVDELKDFFQFCVNAEGVGVSKPDKRVFLEAIRQVVAHPAFQDLELESAHDDEALENIVGPYWIHIGDDFVKDVVAAKSMKMRSIWATELVRDKLMQESETPEVKSGSGLNVEDFVRRVSEMKVIEMSVGADSYLADSIKQEFVDAVAEEFNHLSHILWKWHEEGQCLNRTPTVSLKAPLPVEPLSEPTGTGPTFDAPDENLSLDRISPDELPSIKDSAAKGSEKVESAPKGSRPRAFRLIREDCSMDLPAPLQGRDSKLMKEVMAIAQADKSSGVFSFPIADVESLKEGKLVLMVNVVDAELQFTREVFASMTVEEVLCLTEKNPVILSLYMRKAVDSPGFDLF